MHSSLFTLHSNLHSPFLRRSFQLARLGAGSVAPNPMVGAVIVHDGRIIGEGWHRQYGKAHAEVNAVASVKPEERHLIKDSTIYVSLEPCCIHGNTPPCTDLIQREGIKKVVFSTIDHTPGVDGNSITILEKSGASVEAGILQEESAELVRRRHVFLSQKRPYIILKYAQSSDGFIGRAGERVAITGPMAQRLVHRWRAEEAAILVGTDTAMTDDPALTNRLWYGKSPLRIVLDRRLRLPHSLKVFDGSAPTLLVSECPPAGLPTGIDAFQTAFDGHFWNNLFDYLHSKKIQSTLVEGGAKTLNDLIEKGLWDEVRILTGQNALDNGIPAPRFNGGQLVYNHNIGGDLLEIFFTVNKGRLLIP